MRNRQLQSSFNLKGGLPAATKLYHGDSEHASKFAERYGPGPRPARWVGLLFA